MLERISKLNYRERNNLSLLSCEAARTQESVEKVEGAIKLI